MCSANRLTERGIESFPDPFDVRMTTSEIVRRARLVSIDMKKLDQLASRLAERVRSQHLLTASQFGTHNTSPQRIFIQDTLNFCFWAAKGAPKWAVEYPMGEIHDGWEALTASFDRALAEGIPLLNADYLKTIQQARVRYIFRSDNQTEIPLLEQRVQILRETGEILKKDFTGQVDVLVKRADRDASRIARTVIDHFPAFHDLSIWEGHPVYFFKRAQIFAYDLSLLPNLVITNIESLTAFADYKLPQILRSEGVLRYQKSLARKVNSMEPIPKDSQEELEIRSATVWVCDRIAQTLTVPAATVDNALWLLSQENEEAMRPYHRTLTTSY